MRQLVVNAVAMLLLRDALTEKVEASPITQIVSRIVGVAPTVQHHISASINPNAAEHKAKELHHVCVFASLTRSSV